MFNSIQEALAAGSYSLHTCISTHKDICTESIGIAEREVPAGHCCMSNYHYGMLCCRLNRLKQLEDHSFGIASTMVNVTRALVSALSAQVIYERTRALAIVGRDVPETVALATMP
jgi:hypothetical protein